MDEPWLDAEPQQLWQDLLTVVIALPSALDRQSTATAHFRDCRS
ncbi:hypothetical protein [Nocardia brasiliensis]|nr:hypothetical protein [Nocardia brasiliensis]